MNSRTISIVIKREYLNRVKKKSFLVITFVVPIFFVLLCSLPSLIMVNAKEDSKVVAVVDNSRIVVPVLENSETVEYVDCSQQGVDSVRSNLSALGYDAVLEISKLDTTRKTVSASMYSLKPMGVETSDNINNRINEAVETYRVASYGIDGLDEILEGVKSNVRLRAFTIGEDGEAKVAEATVYMIVSLVFGMLLYMFISMFGGMVMSSVIEEKSNRVVEVLISSVKAVDLMFGKIIGIALVALTQFLLWILLTVGILGVVSVVAGPSLFSMEHNEEMMSMVASDPDMGGITAMAASEDPSEGAVLVSTLMNMPFGKIIICFVIFFIFGYLLYSSLFAAVGSAVDNEGDSMSLQMPLTVPIMLALFISFYTMKAPDSALVFWASIFPFTSPVVMLSRIPYGVPTWELVLAIVLLIATFVLMAWFSAKVYRTGILMFGTKPSWKDIWKWFRQN